MGEGLWRKSCGNLIWSGGESSSLGPGVTYRREWGERWHVKSSVCHADPKADCLQVVEMLMG